MRRSALTSALAALCLLLLVMCGFLFDFGIKQYKNKSRLHLDPINSSAYSEKDSVVKDTAKTLVTIFGDSRAALWPTDKVSDRFQFVNRGVGGQTTAQLLLRFPEDVIDLQPELVVIQAGINDLKTIGLFPERADAIVEECKANLDAITELALAHGIKLILMPVLPTGPVPFPRRIFWSDQIDAAIDAVNAHILVLSQRENVELFDPVALIVDSNGLVTSMYRRDFLHLNGRAYELLSQQLEEFLVKITI